MVWLYKCVLLFGAPGVGKGTQGRILGEIPGFVHMASGDIFRSLDKKSELGRAFLEHSSQGHLVPDDVTIRVWHDHVNRQVAKKVYRPDVHLLVLDGIPRNVYQAKALDVHIKVLRVVHLKPPNIDEMVDRLKGRALKEGRHDDADESVIRRRFEVYDDETAPVLGHYDASLIKDISAVGPPAEVLLHVLEAIIPVCAGKFGNPLG